MTPELLDIRNMGEELACLARLDEPRLPGELSAVSVVRITDGAKAHLAVSIPGKRIYVAPDPPAARSMFSKISSFPGVRAVFLSHRDDVLMCRNAYSLRGAAERGAALGRRSLPWPGLRPGPAAAGRATPPPWGFFYALRFSLHKSGNQNPYFSPFLRSALK